MSSLDVLECEKRFQIKIEIIFFNYTLTNYIDIDNVCVCVLDLSTKVYAFVNCIQLPLYVKQLIDTQTFVRAI